MPKPRKPSVVKPMATKKVVVNRQPSGPARTAKTAVTGQRCERVEGTTKCLSAATAFRQGQHVCPRHTPVGDPHCTHSLGDPCPYCGALLKENPDET